MKIRNAINARQKEHADDTLKPMYTTWGEKIDPSHPLEEYPRPQFRRDNYTMLNGYWDYLIEEDDTLKVTPGAPFSPQGKILVPFSPESLLSGVNRQLQPSERLWYQRCLGDFTHPENIASISRCILHFDAVDQEATVYIDGEQIAHHMGGYLPFCADITDYMRPSADRRSHLLQVCVTDLSDTSYHARGKQKLMRGGMWYTAQSGIWKSVWYEWVPDNPILGMQIFPDFDRKVLNIQVYAEHEWSASPEIFIGNPDIFDGDDDSAMPYQNDIKSEKAPILSLDTCKMPKEDIPMHILLACGGDNTDSIMEYSLKCALPAKIPFKPWSPDEPYLYPMHVIAGQDEADSYFAMRTFSVEMCDHESYQFCLNHHPLFLNGILDQGYWSDSLMTPPDDAAYVFDIQLAKSMGFNMIRKHLKIESPRWYYHCDRMGMLVCQDMVNGGTDYHMSFVCYLTTAAPFITSHISDRHRHLFSRADKAGLDEWERECMQTVDYLGSAPSIAIWCPFNEGWGQFDAARICNLIKEKDPSRPVDHASGWFDQGAGDFKSIHNYFRKLRVKKDKKRAFLISEYGGLSCRIDNHSSVDRIYGYQKYENCAKLQEAYDALGERIRVLKNEGLCGAVYTQLSDVEEEVNGIVTYDRKVVKISKK